MSEAIILVPLDGSEQALSALPVAKVLGEIERADLHIVYVGERRPPSAELLKLDAQVVDGATVDTRAGEPAAEILRAAGEMKARLIVMGTHTAAQAGKILGSTATNVLRNAPCPVVLIPPGCSSISWHLHHVLVPHDGTPTTSGALRPAVELAEHANAELLVAHVTDISAAPAEPGSLTTPRYVDQLQHEWPAWTSEFVKRLACICPLGHLHVRMVLAHGNPAAEIVRLAKQHSTNLVVLAWRGQWEAPRAATLKDILHGAHCPIMVVRTSSRAF
jgi:nucleotide-binding universal stress UspA family protein